MAVAFCPVWEPLCGMSVCFTCLYLVSLVRRSPYVWKGFEGYKPGIWISICNLLVPKSNLYSFPLYSTPAKLKAHTAWCVTFWSQPHLFNKHVLACLHYYYFFITFSFDCVWQTQSWWLNELWKYFSLSSQHLLQHWDSDTLPSQHAEPVLGFLWNPKAWPREAQGVWHCRLRL